MSDSFYSTLASRGGAQKWGLFFGLILVLFFLALVVANNTNQVNAPSPSAGSPDNVIVTLIPDKSAKPRTFEGPAIKDMTVADALAIAGATGNLKITFEQGNVKSIDDSPVGSWAVVKNGQELGDKITEENASAGDKITVSPK